MHHPRGLWTKTQKEAGLYAEKAYQHRPLTYTQPTEPASDSPFLYRCLIGNSNIILLRYDSQTMYQGNLGNSQGFS